MVFFLPIVCFFFLGGQAEIDKFHYFDILENICVLYLELMQCRETVLN